MELNKCGHCDNHHGSSHVIYVNTNNKKQFQDGKSWHTAFSSLQSGLDVAEANPGSEIWVAKGIYIPTKLYTPSGIPGGLYGAQMDPVISPFLNTFSLPNNTSLFGGFKGCEKKRKQRDPTRYPTVLSGAQVSWHVIILGDDIDQTKGVSATLDGFVITDGNARGPVLVSTIFAPFGYAHSYGAGIYSIFGSSLTLDNCILENNYASGLDVTVGATVDAIGGAIFSINSDACITKSLFRNNFSGGQAGAISIYNTYESTPHFAKITECAFFSNKTVNFGGAIVVEGTLPHNDTKTEIDRCIFTGNYALEGGAIVIDSETTIVRESVFIKNYSAVNSGALSTTNIVNTIASNVQSTPVPLVKFTTTLIKCVFKRNITKGDETLRGAILGGLTQISFPLGGGAVTCYMNGLLDIKECSFIKNKAQNGDGGAVLNGDSAANHVLGNPNIVAFAATTNVCDSTFIGNQAVNGGAIASEPSTFVFEPPLDIPISATVLNVRKSLFENNMALVNGGAIYLNRTTAWLKCNEYKCNHAKANKSGRNIYAVDSIIKGVIAPLYVKSD